MSQENVEGNRDLLDGLLVRVPAVAGIIAGGMRR
jgi:hypothetical protein